MNEEGAEFTHASYYTRRGQDLTVGNHLSGEGEVLTHTSAGINPVGTGLPAQYPT